MPNKKINALDVKVAVSTDLMLVGDPATGTAYKSTLSTLPLVPYTGATTNVDLGEFELKAGQVEFDQTPTGTAGVGVLRWNNVDGTLDLGLIGGNVTLQIGQEEVQRVVNKSGGPLNEAAYQVVKVTDAQGQRLAVDLAQGNNDANSTDTLGIVTETIANNQEGYITTSGLVRNINTTGDLQGETWADGDVLYLSPTTAGAITNIKPTAPSHTVTLGYVVYAHQNNGKIFVKCDNGYEIGELHDVSTVGATNGQVLKYNGSIWIPANDTVGTGTVTSVGLTSATSGLTITGSPVTTSGNLNLEIATASGIATGLLSSTDWTTFNNKQTALTNPVTGTGTAGQVSYWSGTNTQTGSNNLFWDAANSRLGIGTNAPSLNSAGTGIDILNNTYTQLRLRSSLSSSGIEFLAFGGNLIELQITPSNNILFYNRTTNTNLLTIATATGNTVVTGNLDAKILTSNNNSTFGRVSIGHNNGAGSSASYYVQTDTVALGNNSIGIYQTAGTAGFRLALFSTGNLLLQNGGTFTDAGYRLDVNGTARVSGLFELSKSNESLTLTGVSAYMSIINAGTYFMGNTGSLFGTNGFNGQTVGFRTNGGFTFGIGTSTYHYLTTGNATFTDVTGLATSTTTTASAVLEARSTTKGFLPPRMTTTQKNAIGTPAQGLMVFDTTLVKLCVYSGTAWETITSI